MGQRSFFWDGVTAGDANTWCVATTDGIGYHMSNEDVVSPWVDIVMRMLTNGTGNRGVLLGWLNALAVTGAASPVSVNTGGAVIYGLAYENDAAVSVTVPTPTNNTRYDRIVVRRTWSTKQARITRIGGTEGGGIPDMTQSPAPSGSGIYDIPLATLEVDTLGNITVTDAREYCTFSTVAGDGTIDTAHLVAEGADLTARSTRSGSFFIGAQDFEIFDPITTEGWVNNTPAFTYGTGLSDYQAIEKVMSWDGALPPGYEAPLDSGYSAVSAAFRVPDNLAGTTLTAYLWHTPVQAACTYYWRTGYQIWQPSGAVSYYGSLYSSYFSGTRVVDRAYRELAASVSSVLPGDLVYYFVEQYNSSGTDHGKVLGIEFTYTGYTP